MGADPKFEKKKLIINNCKLRQPLPIHRLDADGWALEEVVRVRLTLTLPLCPSIGGLANNGQRRSLGLLIIDFFGILDPPLVIKRPWH